MKFFKKIFDHEYKELERFKKIADKVDALEKEYSELPDETLKGKTEEFKERLAKGETLEDILVEHYTIFKENNIEIPFPQRVVQILKDK